MSTWYVSSGIREGQTVRDSFCLSQTRDNGSEGWGLWQTWKEKRKKKEDPGPLYRSHTRVSDTGLVADSCACTGTCNLWISLLPPLPHRSYSKYLQMVTEGGTRGTSQGYLGVQGSVLVDWESSFVKNGGYLMLRDWTLYYRTCFQAHFFLIYSALGRTSS